MSERFYRRLVRAIIKAQNEANSQGLAGVQLQLVLALRKLDGKRK